MGVFDRLGGNLIAEKIRSEAVKAIDKYVESAVLNALLPHADDSAAAEGSIRLNAALKVEIAEMNVTYTEHMGKDSVKSLTIPQTVKDLVLDSVIRAKRPAVLQESDTVSGSDLALSFSGKLDGIGFRQMMMGVGATIDAVSFRVTVTGGASGKWIVPEEVKGADNGCGDRA